MAVGYLFGMGILYLLLFLAQSLLVKTYGLNIAITSPDTEQWLFFAAVLLLGIVVSLIPGLIAYRRSLQDGLTIKV